MSSQEEITLVGIVLTGVYFIVRELRLTVFERRRTQPVVITHEEAMPHFARGGWFARVNVTSDGAAPAFNVRFGIEMRGVRFAYRMEPGDDPRGNVEAVLKDGDSLPRPTTHHLAIPISSEQMWEVASLRVDGQLHQGRMYWCRYENALGQTWETRNPWRRDAKLDIRRVRCLRFREWREQRARLRASRALRGLVDQHQQELSTSGTEG